MRCVTSADGALRVASAAVGTAGDAGCRSHTRPATNAATIVAATAAHARRSLRIHGVHHGAFCSGSLWRMRCHTSRPYCSPRAGASGVAIMASVAAISLYVVAHAAHVPRWASMSSRRRASP
ncbi:MAG: hypothetical protein DMG01_03950 [Acidobacteria bacterium]|nr:MAG: hypothetical protein DMG01_03950 [Acidobacteriota bacterium]